jgi:hypothetical protein
MNKFIPGAAAAALAIAVALPAAAQPDYRWQGGSNNPNWDASHYYHPDRHYDRRLTRNDYVYHGRDGRYYCRRNDGTTGLVVGGLGGAAIGGAIGGNALGALLGGVGGAVIGSSIDRGQVHCR